MTNTHSIRDLEIIEASLCDITNLSRKGVDVTNMLELTCNKLSSILPDVVGSLLHQDIDLAKEEGLINSNDEIVMLIDRGMTVEDLYQRNAS